MKKFLLSISWFNITIFTLSISLWSLSQINNRPRILGSHIENQRIQLTAYAAVPAITSELITDVKSQDSRPVIIENYLVKWNSPMAGSGQFIVNKAEELGNQYKIDPTYLSYLTIAIAQQEGNLGKRMPKKDCFNTWGYGIHSAGTLCFESWEEGITRFMTGVAKDFIAKRGLETPQEIMTRYTPHSPQGAWANGVEQFLADLYSGKF